MPAKRSPKKSRKPAPKPSLADVTPPDLEALTVAPPAPVSLPVDTPPAPKAGPPAGREPRLAGRSQRAGQTRFYAFRRS